MEATVPQIKLRARATDGTDIASLRVMRGMIAELSEKMFSPITCGAYCASITCGLREKIPIGVNYTLDVGHSTYIAATCCGFVNLLTIIAIDIGALISPADFLLMIRQAESLTFAATLSNCSISDRCPL